MGSEDTVARLERLVNMAGVQPDDVPMIRAALDRKHVKHDAAIAGAREIAFFPPMTGG